MVSKGIPFDYRVIFDKIAEDGNIDRVVVVGFARIARDIVRVTVIKRGKRIKKDITISDRYGTGDLIDALFKVRDDVCD